MISERVMSYKLKMAVTQLTHSREKICRRVLTLAQNPRPQGLRSGRRQSQMLPTWGE